MNNPLVIPMTVSESTTSFDMSVDMAINVSGDVDIRPLSVTENGTYREDGKAYTPVTVAVPNSYTQADEGKVVSRGALVSQTSRTVSDNGTYDTTLNNEVVVNVEASLPTAEGRRF